MDVISADFDVKKIETIPGYNIYGAVRDIYYHFVVQNSGDNDHEESDSSIDILNIDQYYVHRFELASLFKGYQNENIQEEKYPLKVQGEAAIIKKDGEVFFYVLFKELDGFVRLNDVPELYETLIADINFINRVEEKLKLDKNYRNEILEHLFPAKNKIEIIPERKKLLSNEIYALLQFEQNRLKAADQWNSGNGVYLFFQRLLTDDQDPTEKLYFSIEQIFDSVASQDRCDCGDPGCFFDMLKTNEKVFLNVVKLNETGEVDKSSLKAEFTKLIQGLDPVEKTVLNQLDDEFGNAVLLNLAFLRDGFDLNNYQFLMTYPYQPDSEDEKWVREVSTMAYYFIKQ